MKESSVIDSMSPHGWVGGSAKLTDVQIDELKGVLEKYNINNSNAFGFINHLFTSHCFYINEYCKILDKGQAYRAKKVPTIIKKDIDLLQKKADELHALIDDLQISTIDYISEKTRQNYGDNFINFRNRVLDDLEMMLLYCRDSEIILTTGKDKELVSRITNDLLNFFELITGKKATRSNNVYKKGEDGEFLHFMRKYFEFLPSEELRKLGINKSQLSGIARKAMDSRNGDIKP